MTNEDKIQQQCVMWFRNTYCLRHNSPRYVIFSVPNERKDKMERMRMVGTGLMAGVSDLVVVMNWPITLYIEMKTETGTQSDEQKEFELTVTALGWKYYVCRSLDQFKAIINENS
jgi:hypothetical protein